MTTSLFLSSLSQILPRSRTKPQLAILIYDRVLAEVIPGFKEWAATFAGAFAVESGESLKSIESFSAFCERLSRAKLDLPARSMTVVAMGGGSVGDFAGFFASVYKRGVRLVHVPTTWLAAIDSAHGGKTALNVGGAKNQIGTFYPAEAVCFVRSIFPETSVEDAIGELAKIALIDGGPWVRQLEKTRLMGNDLMWKFLKSAVDSKLKVVKKDPREEKGLRQILNLGHTLGHISESVHGISHGRAVAQGLFFALEYSHSKKLMKDAAFERAMSLMGVLGLAPHPQALKAADFEQALLADKKRSSKGTVTFVFLKDIGKPVRLDVKLTEVLGEARRQGWIS